MIKIERINKKEKVYDITVKDNHNFFANNILVHNCLEISVPHYPIFDNISIKRNIIFNNNQDRNEYYELRTEAYFHQINEKEANKLVKKMRSLYSFKDSDMTTEVDEREDYDYFDLSGYVNLAEIGVCILGGINVGQCSSNRRLAIVSEYLVRLLEELIDYMDWDLPEAEKAAKMRRTLGIGFSDIFHDLAINKVFYNTTEGRQHIADKIEICSYHMIKTSVELAKEKGKCQLFSDTKYSEGILPIDTYNKNVDELVDPNLKLDWEKLRTEILKYGMRHSTLMANAPFGSCMKLNQKIRTEEGLMNFNNICQRENINVEDLLKQEPQWIDFKTQLKIPTKNGVKNSNKFRFNGIAKTYEIEFEDGYKTRLTGNHKLYCLRDNKYIWVRVDDLKENDDILKM